MQEFGRFDLDQDGSGGPYTLADAVGQPSAVASSGGNYTLVDGFASGTGEPSSTINKTYLPFLQRGQ